MRKDSTQIFVDISAKSEVQRSLIVPFRHDSNQMTLSASITGNGAISAIIQWHGSPVNNYEGGVIIAKSRLTGTNLDTTGKCIEAQWSYVWAEIEANAIVGINAKVNAWIGN